MKAVFRPRFILDIEEAADYLQTEAGEPVVVQWRDALKQTLAALREFPELGRIRADLPIEDIRTFYVKGFANWLVFYRVEKGTVEFLRVKHGMMHLPGLFESKPPSA